MIRDSWEYLNSASLRAKDELSDHIGSRLVHRRERARIGVERERHGGVPEPFAHHLGGTPAANPAVA